MQSESFLVEILPLLQDNDQSEAEMDILDNLEECFVAHNRKTDFQFILLLRAIKTKVFFKLTAAHSLGAKSL